MHRPLSLLCLFAIAACNGESTVTSDAAPRTDASTDAASDAPDTATDATDTACSPLDAETLDRLAMSVLGYIEMQPGESRDLDLGVVECCYSLQDVNACATWSVSPPEAATIDPMTGVLTVDADTPHGTVLTVTANVEEGRREVAAEVYVYTPKGNPLHGFWHEDVQLACGDGAEIEPSDPIGELWFRADGTVWVTWHPFEIYFDYWGEYTFDLETGDLSFTPAGGNYVPDDVDGAGRFVIDDQDRLVLEDIWLGTPQSAAEPTTANCGHRFTR